MSDLAALKARIADELNRSDLTSQIASAITRAIEFYADERFSFNEGRLTLSTTANSDYADYPTGLRKIDSVYATVAGHRYELVKREFDELDRWHGASDTSGQPLDYAVRGTQFYIYPTPNAAYALAVTGIYDQPALSADTDTNAWCTGVAQDLITARCKYTIARDITFDSEVMRNSAIAEREALNRLRSETHALVADGRVSAGW